jgi:hypothetical protein
MHPMNMPGFTAAASLHNASMFQNARANESPWGPFSGSCGCGPGYCCCILCYFYVCYWWCWAPSRLPTGY